MPLKIHWPSRASIGAAAHSSRNSAMARDLESPQRDANLHSDMCRAATSARASCTCVELQRQRTRRRDVDDRRDSLESTTLAQHQRVQCRLNIDSSHNGAHTCAAR
jgi:hypothetical protein